MGEKRMIAVLKDVADRVLIRAAAAYRSGNDSINSVYMGSAAKADLCRILGANYGRGDFDECLARADRATLDRALDYCSRTIEYMQAHPVKTCPTCGAIMAENA
jgi:hypothetical protein